MNSSDSPGLASSLTNVESGASKISPVVVTRCPFSGQTQVKCTPVRVERAEAP